MNKSEIELSVNEVLRRRRYNSQMSAKLNLLQARKNNNFAQNEAKLRAIELDIAKADQKTKKELELQKLNLQKERDQILEDLGMAAQCLEPTPVCKKCNDTGFVGKEQCSCYKNLVLTKLLEESGISSKELVGFSDFNQNVAQDAAQQQELAKYKKFLQEVAEKFPNQKAKCITVCGQTGTGKTFGAKCLAKEMLKKQEPVLFLSAYEFGSMLLKFHTAFVQDKNAIMETLLSPQLLVIDDLGSEPIIRNVTLEYLYVVVSERMASGKITFITTNLSLSHILERYGERIFSRLSDKKLSHLIELKGTDLRHTK